MLEGVAENPPVNSSEPSSAVLFLEYGDTAKPFSSLMDRKSAPDYEAMIYEALCCTVDPNGPDINAILSFINQKFDVPETFKTSVTSKLRRLVLTGELEKVDNHYKYKGATFGVEKSQQVVTNPADRETLQDVAMAVARQISIAENLEQEAIKACEETDKILELLDESLAMQELAKELLERCSRGKTIVLKC